MPPFRFGVPAIVLVLAAACGGSSPSAPSAVTPSTTTQTDAVLAAALQSVVGTTLTQTTGLVGSLTADGFSNVMTQPCPAGGSQTITSTIKLGPPSGTFPAAAPGTMTSSTRVEYNDCRSQTMTINGDPFLAMASEHVFNRGAEGIVSGTSTMRITGGLRFDSNGTLGRVQYDCTRVMTLQVGSAGMVQPSVSSTGTMTLEQPLGSVTVRPCGP